MLEEYDKLIKEVRKEGVPLNRSTLARLAVSEFVKKHSKPDGNPDIKGIAQIVGNQREALDIERKRKEIAEWDTKQKTKK